MSRSYVEGLEKSRDRYQHLQSDHMRITHEAITLAAHVLTLQHCLGRIAAALDTGLPISDKVLDVTDEVLANSQAMLDEVYSCPCGHPSFEHDEGVCAFIHCRKVCA